MPAVEQDLTQGSVTRKLVRYALPLVASSLPHQPVLYSSVAVYAVLPLY